MSLLAAKASTSGSVGTASAVLAAQNRARVKIVVVNTHATQRLSVKFATAVDTAPTAVDGEGVVIFAAGGSLTTEFKGALAIIGAGAATTYSVTEF